MPRAALRERVAGRIAGALARLRAHPRLGSFLPPGYPGLRLTARRVLNYNLVRWQRARGHTRLLGHPLILTLEATNACNLRCPYCFTGAGETGRKRSMMPMPLYRDILRELGPYALMVDFYNWGEPLLNKQLPEMIRIAADHGASTVVSTNLSFAFDRSRAEAIVRSGLAVFGASIDGATQAGYQHYRVGGKLETCLKNLKLMVEVKRDLGSATPSLVWSYHVFPENRHEVETARAMAAELGVEFTATKGWVAGPEWESGAECEFPAVARVEPERCRFLWMHAVINNDGGVAPCSGAFYPEDDFGTVGPGSFREVWNGEKFRAARRLFERRDGSGADLICYECPFTLAWEDRQRHLAQGQASASFAHPYSTNDWFNFFFDRRPANRPRARRAAGTG